MRGTKIEKEEEICATNLTNKTKSMSTNAKKWGKVCVLHHRQNPSESTCRKFVSEYPVPY
jgi:hypothetical protein